MADVFDLGRSLRSADDKDLTHTNERDAWYRFVVSMFVLWGVVLVLSLRVVLRDLRKSSGSTRLETLLKPGRFLRFVIMSTNVIVATARIIFFIDPRGWEDLFPSVAFELLLRVPQCIQLGQWLLIILRWRDLKMFTGPRGIALMRQWTPARWTRITWTFIGLLTLFVTIFTVISESGYQRDKLTDAVNFLLGLFAVVFVLAGLVVGVSAFRAMMESFWSRKSVTTDNPSGRTGKSAREHQAQQILTCLVIATPLTLVLIGVSIWRGNRTLNEKEFFVYLVLKHSVEVAMCFVAMFAIKHPSEDVVEMVRSLSTPITKSATVQRVSRRMKDMVRQLSNNPPDRDSKHVSHNLEIPKFVEGRQATPDSMSMGNSDAGETGIGTACASDQMSAGP